MIGNAVVEFRTAIFDLDGTLVETIPLWQDACTQAYAEFGFELTTWEFQNTYGMSLPQVLKRFNLSLEFEPQIRKRRDDLYIQSLPTVTWKPEVVETLSWLLDRKIQLGVVTNSWRKFVEAMTLTPAFDFFFPVVVTVDDVQKSKPDPEGLLLVMKLLGAESHQTLYTGDHSSDILAAERAGVRSLFLDEQKPFSTVIDYFEYGYCQVL